MLTSTLKNNLIPSATTMQGSSDVRAWIESVVTTTWQDARCGDGRCEAPFEYPEYGRFGCKADCNLLQETSYITPIQVDIYYNFSHPKGSVSPIDLMQDAKWNLCPLEVDELIGPRKIFHGSDCYYEEDQGFEEQVGHIVREIDDVPDGDWTIVVKKDIFLKVAGAVRPKLNVTREAKNKRLLLATHYAQMRRATEVRTYEAIKTHLEVSNLTLAHDVLDLEVIIRNTTIYKANESDTTGEYMNNYLAGNLTAMENKYELNRTMVNASLSLDECQNFFHDEDHLNVTDRTAVPIALHNATWPYTTDELQNACHCPEDAAEGKPTGADALMRCYCFRADFCGAAAVADTSTTWTAAEADDRCTLTDAEAEKVACSETMRWILFGGAAGVEYQGSWERHLAKAWQLNAAAQTTIAAKADEEFDTVLGWLSSLSPVTYFEINQIQGTDPEKLDEASLNALKDDDVLTERAADPNAVLLTDAIRANNPFYEQLIDLIDARLAVVNTPALTDVVYLSPPAFPFNFSYVVPGGLEVANAKYPNEDLHADVDLELTEWNPAVLAREDYAFMTCNLETRAEQYVGTCMKPEDAPAGSPILSNPATGALEVYLEQARFQKLCAEICYCSEEMKDEATGKVTIKSGCDTIAGPGHHCVCEVCTRMEQFDNVVYPSNWTGSNRKLLAHPGSDATSGAALEAPRRPVSDWAAPHRRHLLEVAPFRHGPRFTPQRRNGRRLSQTQADLDSILSAVQDLAVKQTNLDAKVDSVKSAQALANQEAELHHSDTTLETIIRAGFDDLKRGTDSLSASMEEILAKQQQALASAQESLAIQQRTNALAESGLRQIEALAKAVEKQAASIQAAYASGAFNDISQYITIQENAVMTRELKAKTNMLMNQPCQMKVQSYAFTLDNFNNTAPPIAYRERFVGLNNRVLAGMLIYVERKNLVECASNRFGAIDSTCSSGRDISSYGVDPMFKLGTPLYVADYDNYETITKVYNCSDFENPENGVFASYNEDNSTSGNHAPYCRELFNPRDSPYGFRHKSIPGYTDGFPFFIDINLSAAEAKKWMDVMTYGLMIDDVKTDIVTAQLVVYNAELGYFGNIMVYFQFSEGGKIQVSHSVNTIKVELYESAGDWVRFAMEILLVIGVIWSVYEEAMDLIHTKRTKGTYAAYFASAWNYVDVASITIHVVTVIMWFTFAFSLAASFSPDIHYDIYKNLEASAFVTNLRVPNQMAEMGSMFLEMKQLVEYLQTYMTLSGINIILLLGRILKLMDFQPRLGVITHTLALATVDLIHFFIIFILIFMGFAFIGHVIFGYVSSHFNDMTSSVNSLFQNLLGDITYFLEDFKNFDGVNFVVGMIYFYAFNIFVLMIMFNFLLAIICDAFGEVKANASESVGVHVELGPMLADSWKSAFRSFYKNHVPEARVRKQLRIWAGQEESSDSEDELEEHDDVRVFKYDDTKELDAAGLRRVLRRCVVETYQRSAEAKFLLGGSRNRNRDALATAEEIEAAADMLLAQVGDVAEPAEDEDEAPSEIEALQTSLEKLLKAQQKLVEGQVKVIEGQARMADRQERLSDLEQKILGVLAKPPEQL